MKTYLLLEQKRGIYALFLCERLGSHGGSERVIAQFLAKGIKMTSYPFEAEYFSLESGSRFQVYSIPLVGDSDTITEIVEVEGFSPLDSSDLDIVNTGEVNVIDFWNLFKQKVS